MEKILIVRLGAMGDVLHGLPAVAALRERYPKAQIGWLVERRWKDLVSSAVMPGGGDRPLVDTIHASDTSTWRGRLLSRTTRAELAALRRSLREAAYPEAIDLQGALKSALLMRSSGSARRIGFARPRERAAVLFYTETVAAARAHVIEQNLELVSGAADEALSAVRPEFRLHAAARDECDHRLPWRGMDPYAVLVPGAGWGAKQWPPERYGQLAAGLMRLGLRVVVNAGPGERGLAQQINVSAGAELPSFEGSTQQLIELMRQARLLVGGDTGPMHLANMMGVPVVAVFGPTDPARNGPYYRPAEVLRSKASATSYSHSLHKDPAMENISAEDALAAAARLLAV